MKPIRHTLRKAIALLAALCVALACSAALAEVEAKADKTAVEAGDTVTVTLTVTGEGLSVASGTYSYDPALLTFEEGDGGAGDGFFALHSAEKNGSSTLTARFTFKAAGEGEAKVAFALESLLDYSGKERDKGSAELSISIAPAPPKPTPEPVNYADPNVGVPAQNVEGAVGAMYVWRSIENVTIPSRYTEAQLDYHGETVAGAAVKDSDAPELVYLSGPAGENAGYHIYDRAADRLYPYRTVSSSSKSYILLTPDGAVPVPEGFTETTLTIDEEAIPAWTATDAQGEVYLLYARNPQGEVGFYLYNPADEALQRYAVLPARPVVVEPAEAPATPAPEADATPAAEAPAPERGEGQMVIGSVLFYCVCGVAALSLAGLATVLIVNAAREKQRRARAAERSNRERAAMEAGNTTPIEK